MNKSTILGKSLLLLTCLCNALDAVLLLRPGRAAAVLAVSTMGSSYLAVLAWHRPESEQVCPAVSTAEVAAAPLLEMEALTSLSQLTCCFQKVSFCLASCAHLAHQAGSHTCTPARRAWGGSLVFLLATRLATDLTYATALLPSLIGKMLPCGKMSHISSPAVLPFSHLK